ncbi:ABC family transporter permease protein, partial [Methylorubrum extorquens DSM 13060]
MTRKAASFPRGRALPVAGVVLALLVGWYLAALLGNWN